MSQQPTAAVTATQQVSRESRDDSEGYQLPARPLACRPCRFRRVKCDHVQPICGACVKAALPCEYPVERKKKRARDVSDASGTQDVVPGPSTAVPTIPEPLAKDPAPADVSLPFGHVALDQIGVNVPPVDIPLDIDWDSLLNFPASSSAYVWPDVFGDTFIQSAPALQQTQSTYQGQQIAMALENQQATIRRDPEDDQSLELYYYRFSGSTAIQPGINRVSLRLQRKETAGSPIASVAQPEPDTASNFVGDITFDEEGMPLASTYEAMLEIFYRRLSPHFPAISRRRMRERVMSGTMSQFLANCICALGSRFGEQQPTRRSSIFIAKAQEFILPLTQLPTTEATSGLILLGWALYGQGNDSGFWQLTGMAIRMGLDIGIHQVSEIYDSTAHLTRTRLLFWTLFITDRIISFSNGRPASIAEEIIEIPLPDDADLFPDPARDDAQAEILEPVPFVYFVRLMIIVGRISNLLNGRRGRPRTLVTHSDNPTGQLRDLQLRLLQFFGTLPESLQWSPEKFRHQHARGHAGMYLALHLWSHAVLALTYHPELLRSPSGVDTPLNQGMSRNMQLAMTSSKQISECMVFADLVDEASYTSTPYLVQPLYVASMALIHEMKLHQTSSDPTHTYLAAMAKQNLSALLKALSRIADHWAGARPVLELLEKRSGIPVSKSSNNRNVYIFLPDRGILRRFAADPNHPDHIAQPTETSLRKSIAQPLMESPGQLWLSDLMNGYNVESASVQPADNHDLATLLRNRSY